MPISGMTMARPTARRRTAPFSARDRPLRSRVHSRIKTATNEDRIMTASAIREPNATWAGREQGERQAQGGRREDGDLHRARRMTAKKALRQQKGRQGRQRYGGVGRAFEDRQARPDGQTAYAVEDRHDPEQKDQARRQRAADAAHEQGRDIGRQTPPPRNRPAGPGSRRGSCRAPSATWS